MTDLNTPSRITSLDAIRGFAVMGILAMNIVAFSMPDAAYLNPRAYGGTTPLDLAVWAFNFVLVDGKMRGLFSLLFGASTLLVIESAEAKGENGVSLHIRRMAWLALFGLAHYFLIWFGDILFLYAAIGMLAFLFRERSPRELIKWAILLLTLNALMFAAMSAAMLSMQAMAAAPDAGAETIKSYREMLEGLGDPASPDIAKQLAIYSGDYAGQFAERAGRWYWLAIGVLLNGVETLGFMLLGMALLKNGFLKGEWERRRYARLALILYAIALPAMIALAWWCFASGFETLVTFTSVLGWAAPFRVMLIVAHAAVFMLLIERFRTSAFIARVAAAGRAAFTNYLGTSLVMTTIFYGWGGGLFGEVSRAQAYLFVFAMWAVMLLWSKPWLDRFQYGPLEWLWRSLTRMRPQAMRPRVAN